MLDLLIVGAFAGLLVGAFWVARRLTPVVVATGLVIGLAGNLVQLTTALGIGWTARGLQVLGIVAAAAVLAVAYAYRSPRASLRRPLLAVAAPAGAIALGLLGLRLLSDAAPLTAVGYLINHPQAEDNAKWLHLTSQLAQGSEVSFNGYAGGPLLVLLAMVAAFVSVLSTVLLGGVNEVAVAANSVVFAQHLLIAIVPFALAPLAEVRIRRHGGPKSPLPITTIVLASLVLATASAVITSYGHLSLQWVLLVLVTWSACFVAETRFGFRALATLTIVTVASVWVPLNVLGLAIGIGVAVVALRRRHRLLFAISVVTLVLSLDALLSSLLFLVGIQFTWTPLDSPADSGLSLDRPLGDSAMAPAQSLFTAPGGVEIIAPIVGVLAAVSVLGAAWARRDRIGMTMLPIGLLVGYLVAIQLADAVVTAAAPHYGGHKVAFATVITALVSTLPVALGTLGPGAGMTGLRWVGAGAVLGLLVVDTMLPRAVSALSPQLWPANAAERPTYWSVAEVRPTANQPISSLPIACVFAPPTAEQPTALPLGQEAYGCTRLLVGLTGLEGRATPVATWLAQDWLSQQPTWATSAEWLELLPAEVLDRPVALMSETGGTAGLTTLRALLSASPVLQRSL